MWSFNKKKQKKEEDKKPRLTKYSISTYPMPEPYMPTGMDNDSGEK